MAVNNNADDYAANRQGIYFPADTNNTLAVGNLTGQCVSLVKWFLAEMTSVPNPANARGNAKDFGNTLVAQGHAYEVSADQRQRGDIVVWKQDGGGYGHIGILLSSDRVFEQNVGLAGLPSANYFGNIVYPSRIDPLYVNWRKGTPSFYRVRTYNEQSAPGGDEMITADVLGALYNDLLGRNPDQGAYDHYVGKYTTNFVVADLRASAEYAAYQTNKNAVVTTLQGQVTDLNNQLATSSKANTTLQSQIDTLNTTIATLEAKIEELEKNSGKPTQPEKPLSDYDVSELFRAFLNKLFGK